MIPCRHDMLSTNHTAKSICSASHVSRTNDIFAEAKQTVTQKAQARRWSATATSNSATQKTPPYLQQDTEVLMQSIS